MMILVIAYALSVGFVLAPALDMVRCGESSLPVAVLLAIVWPLAFVAYPFIGNHWEHRCGCGHAVAANSEWVCDARLWWHAFRSPACRRDGLPFATLVWRAVRRR